MTADPSIYGLIKAPPAPLEQYGQVLNLKALMGQGKLQDLQTQAAERTAAQDSALDQVFANAPAGATLESLVPAAIRANPKAGIELQGKALEQKVKQAGLEHTQTQTKDITAGHIAGAWAALAQGGGSDESVKAAHDMMAPLVGDERATAVTQQLLSMPPQTRLAYAVSQAGQHKVGQEALKLFFPQAHMQDTGGGVTPVSTSTLPGSAPAGTPISGTQPLQKTQTPDSVATDKRVQSEGALNRANHLLIAGLGPDGKPTNGAEDHVDLATVKPVDLEAAYRYFSDGTLPPNMGRGQQGMAESRRIRGIAAQIGQSLGIEPGEARANQLAFKGAGQAITALVKREAQVGANVRNFDFNSDQVLQLSKQVDRTGMPVVNSWILAGRRAVQGDPAVSAFDVAVKTTVNEFAQIVSGTTAGATTEGEKQKAEKLLAAQQTPEQIAAVINQMRIESQNRMKSFADQKKETLGNLRAGGPKPDATPAPVAPAAAPKPAAAGKIAQPVKFLGFE